MKHICCLIFGLVALSSLAAWGAPGSLTAGTVIQPPGPLSRIVRSQISLDMKATGGYFLMRVTKDGKTISVPKNMAYQTETGKFAWEPTESQVGAYEIIFAPRTGKGAGAIARVKITVTPRAICSGSSEVCKLLERWYAEGTAAGNTGDFYDNRDNGHSRLNTDRLFPQLDRITYTDETRKTLGWALQRRLLEGTVFGNSSTSAGPTTGGSNPRIYYRSPGGLAFLYRQYRHNDLYVYPEHRDHDPGHNGRGGGYGDLYPANTPYLIISQGSSGSDQPFLRAIAATLAALRPAVKARLVQRGLLMPTFQMVFRMSNKGVSDEEAYLTGQAHPTVFGGKQIDDLKMVQMAHGLRLNTIPPMIQLKVLKEDQNIVGRDYFEPPPLATERLADTRAAIARVVRGPQYVRTMVVSAEESFDLNKRKLTWHWRILRGDPEKVEIVPRNDSHSVVELRVAYQPRRPIGNGDPMESNRVDIGAFVHNGRYYSAPGFVTFYTLDREDRTYTEDGRLVEVDYKARSSAIDFDAITDWSLFLQAIVKGGNSLGGRLLKRSFQPSELARIREITSEYQLRYDQMRAEVRPYETALAEVKTQQNAAREAGRELKLAEKAYSVEKTAEKRRALDKARRLQQEATRRSDQTKKPLRELKKAADKARGEANRFLRETKVDGVSSVADRLLAILNTIKDDATLYIGHAEAIDGLARSHPAAGKLSVASMIGELRELQIVKETPEGLKLNPLLAGDVPAGERLTGFQRSQLQRVHLEIMNHLLYHAFLDQPTRENYCDTFLTAAKPWRDLYRYASDDTCLGWSRWIDGKTIDFNAEGHKILEKDALGRATKVRTVIYRGNRSNPRQRWKLGCLDGDAIIDYTYQSPEDYVGAPSSLRSK